VSYHTKSVNVKMTTRQVQESTKSYILNTQEQ